LNLPGKLLGRVRWINLQSLFPHELDHIGLRHDADDFGVEFLENAAGQGRLLGWHVLYALEVLAPLTAATRL